MCELESLKDEFNVIALTEVFLKNKFVDIEEQLNSFNLKDFKIYCNSNPRRGVCLYVKENISSKQLHFESCKNQSCEVCLVEISISNEKFFYWCFL